MSASSQPQVTPERIGQLVWGYAPPLILEAAIRHRVFDVLDGGPKTADEVEDATGASARGLSAVMNALVTELPHQRPAGPLRTHSGKRRISGQHQARFQGRHDSPL